MESVTVPPSPKLDEWKKMKQTPGSFGCRIRLEPSLSMRAGASQVKGKFMSGLRRRLISSSHRLLQLRLNRCLEDQHFVSLVSYLSILVIRLIPKVLSFEALLSCSSPIVSKYCFLPLSLAHLWISETCRDSFSFYI